MASLGSPTFGHSRLHCLWVAARRMRVLTEVSICPLQLCIWGISANQPPAMIRIGQINL